MRGGNPAYIERLDHLIGGATRNIRQIPIINQGQVGVQLFMVISGSILAIISYDKELDDATTIAKQLTLEIYHMLEGETAETATGFALSIIRPQGFGMLSGVLYFAHSHCPPRRGTAAAAASAVRQRHPRPTHTSIPRENRICEN
jgi:hypothetical protein